MTGRTKADTIRSQSYISSEAHPAHPQVAEPPEPGSQEKESAASPGSSDTSVSMSKSQMPEEYGEQSQMPKMKKAKTYTHLTIYTITCKIVLQTGWTEQELRENDRIVLQTSRTY